MKKTLVIADDHEIVRSGLRAVLAAEPDLEVVGETGDGLAVTPLVERVRPHVLVLDLKLPNLGGLEIARQVSRRAPRTRIVFVSIYGNEPYVVEAFQAGARAYA